MIKGCILPWVHLYGDIQGNYRVCCFSSNNVVLGTSNQDISEVWNDEPYKKLRLQFLNNEIPEQCKEPCYNKENLVTSPRITCNQEWHKYEILQAKTEKDGTLASPPLYIDIRFGNLCNFKCRMCGPRSSTAWIHEAKKLFNETGIYQDNYTNNKKFWDGLELIYPYIQQVYFAGGEPFMLEGHYKLLKYLISKKQTNITINYNTNLSILKYKQYNLLSLWSQFKKVSIWVSCDGYKDVGEYIRTGFKWNTFENNFKIIKPYAGCISSVVSILSLYTLPDLFIWAKRNNTGLYGSTLTNPSYLSCKILPKHEKEKVILYYEKFMKENKTFFQNNLETKHIIGWLKFMMSDIENRETNEILFKQYTEKLDSHRKEKFIEIVPQLKDWYDNIKI